MSQWKTKQTQENQVGKCTFAFQANILTHLVHISSEEIDPGAFNYDVLVGAVWLEGNPPGFDLRVQGQITVREPSGTDALGEIRGGYYDNR